MCSQRYGGSRTEPPVLQRILQGRSGARARRLPARAEPHTVVHLRIVVPADRFDRALGVLVGTDTVCNIITMRGAATRPSGDVVLCDIPREDASVVIQDLRTLGVERDGSIAIEAVDSEVSRIGAAAERHARGHAADAVVWEEVAGRTSEESTLSGVYVLFMVLAMVIATVGILLNSPILIVGAMVVGPEFGPLAGLCVAFVQRRPRNAWRSAIALVIGFPAGITTTVLLLYLLRWVGVAPDTFSSAEHGLSRSIASPDAYAAIVALSAGVVGMLSLTSAKSGALVGVLISVTTVPAAANIGISFVYQDWSAWRGSQGQLMINLSCIVLSGILTLTIQQLAYRRRLARHQGDLRAAGIL